jgi:hypothetical protein
MIAATRIETREVASGRVGFLVAIPTQAGLGQIGGASCRAGLFRNATGSVNDAQKENPARATHAACFVLADDDHARRLVSCDEIYSSATPGGYRHDLPSSR